MHKISCLLVRGLPLLVVYGSLLATGSIGELDFLDTFAARSLVQISYRHQKYDTIGPHGMLEVEETYDRSRQLGRVLINADNGYRIELYARPKAGLYLEAKYNPAGDMMSCNVANDRSSTNGFFELFNELAGVCDEEEQQCGHLIGPSALVYRFRNELPAEWSQQVAMGINENKQNGSTFGATTNVTVDERAGERRRRLIVNPNPIELTLTSPTRLRGRKVIFRRSDFLMERAPLLSQLASFVSYIDGIGRKFTMDLVSLQEIDLSRRSWDPFHLPTGFGCSPEASTILRGPVYQLNEHWSTRMPINSDWISATLYGPGLQPDGVHLAMDLNSGLLKLNIKDQSMNVVDAKRGIIYHQPLEKALGSEKDPDLEANINNDECTIISTNPFLGSITSLRESEISKSAYPNATGGGISQFADRWRQLVGSTNYIMYLGQTRYRDRPLVHEFELTYSSTNLLPTYFGLLADQNINTLDLRYTRVLARLWIAFDSYCTDLYSAGGTCEEPLILGFKVELISRAGKVSWTQEIRLMEFQWALEEDGLVERPFDVFDLRQCPLSKILLSLHVKWMETLDNEQKLTKLEVNETTSHSVPPDLDVFVAKQLLTYFHGEMSHKDLGVVSLERQSSIPPGARVARYMLELAEYPKESIGFKSASVVNNTIIIGEPIDLLGAGGTLFECLAWASQFAQSKAVTYSRVKGCQIYSKYRLVSEKSGIESDEDKYLLYTRRVEQLEPPVGDHSVRLFHLEHLDSINNEMKNDCKKGNKHRALVDGTTLAQDIRLVSLKVASETYGQLAIATALSTHSGYRFANLDQSECNSLTQCQSHCDVEPNCNAFSYCRYPDSGHEFCQLNFTKLASTIDDNQGPVATMGSAIEGSYGHGSELTRDAGCEIHAKNYLHYFEPLNSDTKLSWDLNETYSMWHLAPNATGKLDCARVCYSLQDNSCMRFIFCPAISYEAQKCLIWLDLNENPSENFLYSVEGLKSEVKSNMSAAQYGCSIFKQKAMTLYRRTLDSRASGFNWAGKSLRQSKWQNINRDQCAERCTEDTECQSFDYCSVESKGKPFAKGSNPFTFTSLECILLSGSIYDSQQMYLDPEPEAPEGGKQTKILEDRRQCNHYEHSAAKGRSSAQAGEIIVNNMAHGIRSGEEDAGSLDLQTSYAGSLFKAALLGLTLGVAINGLATIWAILKTKRAGLTG